MFFVLKKKNLALVINICLKKKKNVRSWSKNIIFVMKNTQKTKILPTCTWWYYNR